MNFDFPWPPTTNNLFASVGNRRIKTKAYNSYIKACQDKVLESLIPRFTFEKQRLSVVILCHAPNKRLYDIDNRAKAALDALQTCGIIENDSQLDHLTLVRGAPHPGGRICVHIEAIANA